VLLFSLHYERRLFIVLWVFAVLTCTANYLFAVLTCTANYLFAVLTCTANYLFHVFKLTISVSDIYIMVGNVGIVSNC